MLSLKFGFYLNFLFKSVVVKAGIGTSLWVVIRQVGVRVLRDLQKSSSIIISIFFLAIVGKVKNRNTKVLTVLFFCVVTVMF